VPLDSLKILREANYIEHSQEYDVDEVLGSTRKGRYVLYLVKWLDCPDLKDWTEEPYNNFSVHGLEKLREFHRRNPDAPRDYRLTESKTPIRPGRMTKPKRLKHDRGVVG